MTRTAEKHDRVLAVLRDDAASLLRLARVHSICASDAEDAYQRALVIFLERVDRVLPETAGAWLRTVVKHEAMAIRAARRRAVADVEVDFDAYRGDLDDGDEQALRFDRVTRAAEALQRCKGDEVTALMLKAEGHSYDEIGRLTGWSYTKVNRAIAEGRARFLKTYSSIESGAECDKWAPMLSAIADGEATARDMEQVRPHLRNCAACRAVLRELYEAQPAIRVVLPAGLLFGGGAADAGVSLLTRMYESIAGSLHESALRVQAAVEAVGSGKAAAVAASAAAIAGGGFVVEEAVREPERTARAAAAVVQPRVVRATPTPTPSPSATPIAAAAVTDAPVRSTVVQPVRRRPKPKPTPAATPAAEETTGEFFGSSQHPRRPAPATTTTSSSKPKTSGSEGEFFNP